MMTENGRLAMLLHEIKTFAMQTPPSIEYTELTLADIQMVFVDSLDPSQFAVTTIGHINDAGFLALRRNVEVATTVGKFIVDLYHDEKGQILWELHEELVAIFTFTSTARKAWYQLLSFQTS